MSEQEIPTEQAEQVEQVQAEQESVAEQAPQAEAQPETQPETQPDARPDTETQPETQPAEPEQHAVAAQQPATEQQTPAEPAPAEQPAPSPRPVPRPVPKPSAVPHPPAVPHAPAVQHAPVATPSADTGIPSEEARAFGRVADDGTVFVRTGDGEREVGSYPGATPDEALAYFGRKHEDLVAQADLAEQRLSVPDAPVAETGKAVARLRESLPTAQVVGDLDALARRLDELKAELGRIRKEADAQRAAAKTRAAEQRAELVAEAEKIAEIDPERRQWKSSGDRLRELFDAWKQQQRSGPRIDKSTEDDLWKRFGHARTTFDRLRRQHFAQLDERHGEVKAIKEKIVKEAEALAASKDWGPTSTAYRTLMDRWKAAGRASRRDDDALWKRFRSAQDQFFGARTADNAAQDAEFQANLAVKEALLAEAERLVPVTDLAAAKARLRDIQDRWDAAGKVPRADVSRVEKRMRTVEEALRKLDDDRWTRSNPETRARAEGALGQLEESIAALESDLADARERGDARAERDAEQALAARRAWLEQVQQAADDLAH